MPPSAPLTLFNSLSRKAEAFAPIHAGEARVYSCGPTVYNYQHIGNMRAYVFADTLGRTLSWKGYKLTHIINITDVGHLTSDADAGDDKMEKAAAAAGKSAWDIAKFYTEAFWADIARLNIRPPAKWSIATEHVEEMIAFAERIAPDHCYQLDSGLYFDSSTVPDYGRLARAATEASEAGGESRIDPVEGKRHPGDFAIWRKTPAGETRQMEWDSPWGRGAPGWHLECSVMSMQYLGARFDIHTGGIDHREIHHPNEIAQNQAFTHSDHPGANIWMHNNFLVAKKQDGRGGKMAKSGGGFLILQTLVGAGVHPLAYRLMCLQAHYRSELEFSWDNLLAALTRLKRLAMAVAQIRESGADARVPPPREHDERIAGLLGAFDQALSDDLNTPKALTVLDELVGDADIDPAAQRAAVEQMDAILGLDLVTLKRTDLRIRPASAEIDEQEIARQLDLRDEARTEKNFPAADAIRDILAERGVEIMDGDPLRWDWKIAP